MINKDLTDKELDNSIHPVLNNPYKLVWKDGSFDQESTNIIENIESKNPGFSKTLYNMSKCFRFYNKSIGYADYHRQFKNVNGVDLDVHIIITNKKVDNNDILVERLKQFKKSCGLHNPEISKLIDNYIKNRDEYKEKYLGKYIRLTIGGNIEISDDYLDPYLDQICFHIGNEFSVEPKALLLQGFRFEKTDTSTSSLYLV